MLEMIYGEQIYRDHSSARVVNNTIQNNASNGLSPAKTHLHELGFSSQTTRSQAPTPFRGMETAESS
jgi:hypothetical protein